MRPVTRKERVVGFPASPVTRTCVSKGAAGDFGRQIFNG
jgi:hypothetical protein